MPKKSSAKSANPFRSHPIGNCGVKAAGQQLTIINAMTTKTLQIGFRANLDTDGQGFSYVEDTRIAASCYGRNGTATKQLKTLLEREVNEALDCRANHAKRMIGTRSGDVFLVQWFGPTYGYSIAGPGRTYSGSTLGPWKTINDCIPEARKHAESSFGGIAWECSV